MSDHPVGRARLSELPLPPYSYVPRHAPHPVSDPRGHMHGHVAQPAPALNPTNWRDSETYLYALDLFNHGYYWEAHEAWESLWHAAGRAGSTAVWLKALIKLAAAGVKAREGSAVGVGRHGRRALELLSEVGVANAPSSQYCGLQLDDVERIIKELIERAPTFDSPQPTLLLPWQLTPVAC